MPRQQPNEVTMVYNKQSLPESVKPSQPTSEERSAQKFNVNQIERERQAKVTPRPEKNERDSRTSSNANRFSQRSDENDGNPIYESPQNAKSADRHRSLGCAQKIVFPVLNEV